MGLVECRRGVLLGMDVKAGERTDLQPSHACEGVPDVNRHTASRYRKIPLPQEAL